MFLGGGGATRWCSSPLTSATVQSGIMILISFSSDMDGNSVVFEVIMESCAFMENIVVS